MMHRAALALGVAAAALAAVGLYQWQAVSDDPASESAGPHFVVRDPDPDLGLLVVGTTTEFAYDITNTGTAPVCIIGFEGSGCGTTWCITPRFHCGISDRSAPIPPGETLRFPCELKITRPGPIDWTMALFIDDNGIHKVRLTVRGTAVAAEGPQNATPNP